MLNAELRNRARNPALVSGSDLNQREVAIAAARQTIPRVFTLLITLRICSRSVPERRTIVVEVCRRPVLETTSRAASDRFHY